MKGFEIIENNRKEVEKQLELTTEDALRIIGMQAESDISLITPVETGNLKGSITSDVDASKSTVTIGTTVEYAPYQELGTKKMRAANGGKGFFRFALDRNVKKYFAIYEEMLKK